MRMTSRHVRRQDEDEDEDEDDEDEEGMVIRMLNRMYYQSRVKRLFQTVFDAISFSACFLSSPNPA